MSESVFARKQLRKHGWTDGCGLGRDEDGIRDAIKVKIKKDLHGVGHNAGKEFTFHWWDHAFNKAVNSIRVETSEDGVTVSKSSESSKKKDKNSLYSCFVKGGTLLDNKEEMTPACDEDDLDSEEEWDRNRPSEDHVFKMCGGRTAHKAARFGHKLNGKLKRIAEHEEMLLQQRVSHSRHSTDKTTDQSNVQSQVGSHSDVKKKKRKDKKKDKKIEATENGLEVDKVSDNTNRCSRIDEFKFEKDEMLSEKMETPDCLKKENKRDKKLKHVKNEMLSEKVEITENQKPCRKTQKPRDLTDVDKTVDLNVSNSHLDNLDGDVTKDLKRRKRNKDKKKQKRLVEDLEECNHGDSVMEVMETSLANCIDCRNLEENNKSLKQSRKRKDCEKPEKKDVGMSSDNRVAESAELGVDEKSLRRIKKAKRREQKRLDKEKMKKLESDVIDLPPDTKRKKRKKESKNREEITPLDTDSVQSDQLYIQDSSDLFHDHVRRFVSGLQEADQLGALLSEAVEGKDSAFPSPNNYHSVTKLNLKAARLLDIYDSDCFLSSHLLDELKASRLHCQKEVFLKFLEIVVVLFQKYMSTIHT